MREIIGDRRLGQPHALCDGAPRKPIDAGQHHNLAALRRKTVQRRLQVAQLIARLHDTIRPRYFGGSFQRLEIGHRLDRHDVFAAHAIDQKIARRREHELLGAFGDFFAR